MNTTGVGTPLSVEQCGVCSYDADEVEDTRTVVALLRMPCEQDGRTIPLSGDSGAIGEHRRVDSLFRLLGHQEAAVRHAAITALISLNPPDLPERTRLMMHDPSPLVREAAAGIAGHVGYPDCIGPLLGLRHDPVESVRSAAVEGLASVPEPRACDMLIHSLTCDTPRVREAAARALGKVDPAISTGPLIAALDDPEPWVRYHVARSLGQHAAPAAMDRLALAARSDPANQVRAAAIEAVGHIGGDRAPGILAPLVRSDDAELARAALHALARLDHPDALPPIQWALHAPDPEVRANAAQALADRGGQGVAEALEWMAATDTDPWVVQSAVNALGSLRTSRAIAALISLSAEPANHEACVQALALAGESRVDEVAQGLRHSQAEVRRVVLEALGRIKNPKVSALIPDAMRESGSKPRTGGTDAVGMTA